jgi:hypothetical protein
MDMDAAEPRVRAVVLQHDVTVGAARELRERIELGMRHAPAKLLAGKLVGEHARYP